MFQLLSATPSALRKQYVEDFKVGKIDIIVNVNIFSEGFDCPDIEFIQLARPTRSLTMYIQQVGRGLRKADGKQKCIILDNVGMYSRFGLPDANRHWRAHFNGQEVDESPKAIRENGWGDFLYEAPDLSEGDEDMLLIQEADNTTNYEADEMEIIEAEEAKEERPAPKMKTVDNSAEYPAKKDNDSPKADGKKLKKVPAMKPKYTLESLAFAEGRYSIVADNSFYYVKSLFSGNCYFIAPVARKPSEVDEIIVREDAGHYIIEHVIPEAEKATLQSIGEIELEEDGIITFTQYFGTRKIASSFEIV